LRASFAVLRSVQDTSDSGGEFSLISRYLKNLDGGDAVALGNGDDAAVLCLESCEQLAVSVDSMLDGVHFPRGSSAERVAYRAVAAAASDLAAMGARPLGMTLALSLPEANGEWMASCRCGLAASVEDFLLPLVGGDLTRGPLALTVQVMGAVAKGGAITRGGAAAGDSLYVSGCLGEAAAGLAVLEGRLAADAATADLLRDRFWRPRPALALGRQLCGAATAAIDISDGLLADARHIAEASAVKLSIRSDLLPISQALLAVVSREQALRWALTGGEDYLLCFTLPDGASCPEGCTRIGGVEAGSGVYCDDVEISGGYQHF